MLKYSSFMSMHCKNQECVIDFSNANLFFTFGGGGCYYQLILSSIMDGILNPD